MTRKGIIFGLIAFGLAVAIFASFVGGFYFGQLRKQVLVEDSAHVESVLIAAIHKNMDAAYAKRLHEGEIERSEFDEYILRSLLNNIANLCLVEELATDEEVEELSTATVKVRTGQPTRILMQAGRSMDLLGFEDSTDLDQFFQANPEKVDWFDESLFNEQAQITDSFADFADRAVEHLKSLKLLGK